MGNPFSNLFGQSPISPIQEHIKLAHGCATLLTPFFEAVLAEQWDQAEAIYQEISSLEHEADIAKANLRANLPNTLLLPVDRGDILVMVSQQDEIANMSKDIAGVVTGRKMSIPEVIASSMQQFVDLAIQTSAQAMKTVQEMDELLELGFKGRILEVIAELVEELNRLEHENDELQIKIRADLFKIEDTLPPVNVIFLYKIIESIGKLADAAQSAGGKLPILIAR